MKGPRTLVGNNNRGHTDVLAHLCSTHHHLLSTLQQGPQSCPWASQIVFHPKVLGKHLQEWPEFLEAKTSQRNSNWEIAIVSACRKANWVFLFNIYLCRSLSLWILKHININIRQMFHIRNRQIIYLSLATLLPSKLSLSLSLAWTSLKVGTDCMGFWEVL